MIRELDVVRFRAGQMAATLLEFPEVDRPAAERFLRWFHEAKGEPPKYVHDFVHDHGQSLDWLWRGDIVPTLREKYRRRGE